MTMICFSKLVFAVALMLGGGTGFAVTVAEAAGVYVGKSIFAVEDPDPIFASFEHLDHVTVLDASGRVFVTRYSKEKGQFQFVSLHSPIRLPSDLEEGNFEFDVEQIEGSFQSDGGHLLLKFRAPLPDPGRFVFWEIKGQRLPDNQESRRIMTELQRLVSSVTQADLSSARGTE